MRRGQPAGIGGDRPDGELANDHGGGAPPSRRSGFEINSITVLDRDTVARSEERKLNGVFRGLPGVILQTPGSRGSLSGLFVRGASAGLGQLSFDGVPLYGLVNGIFNLSAVPSMRWSASRSCVGRAARVTGAGPSGALYGSRSRDARRRGFLHLEGGSYNTLSETVGGALRGAKARAIVTASRDDISWADSRNGNPERDGFRATQGIARLTLAPSARLTLDSSALYRQSRAEIDAPGLLPTGQIGFVDDLGAFAREETWVAQTAAHGHIRAGWESSLQLGFTRNRASLRAFNQPFGFDQRLLLARWTNTQSVYRGTPDKGSGLAAPHVGLVWGAEVQQQEGENQFDLPGRRLHDSRTLIAGLLEVQGDSGPWAGFLGTSIDHYDDFGTHPTLYAGLSRWATPALKLRASGGYTNSRDLDSGRVLPRRPYHQGRAYCEWQISAVPLTLGSELVYRGSHFDDSEALFRAGDAVYLNAQMSYRILPALQVYLRGENLTDDRTPEVFSFGARGAAVFGGVRLHL